MRLRDLKWYILASIILIVSYAAVSLCYYLSIRSGLIQQSMNKIALEVSLSYNDMFAGEIKSKYQEFAGLTSEELVKYIYTGDNIEELGEDSEYKYEIALNQSSYTTKFDDCGDDYKIHIAREYNFNRQASDEKPDMSYYIYFARLNSDGMGGNLVPSLSKSRYITVRIPLAYFIEHSSINTATGYGFIVYEGNSAANVGFKTSAFDISTLDDLTQAYKSYYTDLEFSGVKYPSAINHIISYGGVEYSTAALNLQYINSSNEAVSLTSGYNASLSDPNETTNIYLMVLIPTTNAILGSSWILGQALIFFFAGVVVMVAMLVILILGCRKSSQLLRADRKSTEKTSAIVIRIDPNGNVIFTNKTFKQMYGLTPLSTVSEFIDVETHEPILNTIKKNKNFTCEVDSDPLGESDIHYLTLTPLFISDSYYLMGTEITSEYRRRVHLEEMSGKNEYTKCPNGFMLANQYETILENNLAYDVAFVEYDIDKYDEIISVFGRTNFNILLNKLLELFRAHYDGFDIYHVTDAKFIIVQPNTSTAEIEERINAILGELEKPFPIKHNNVAVSAHVVIFNYKRTDLEREDAKKITYEEIRTKLDLAYRNIKQLSSKPYVFYEPRMDEIILQADEMEKDIEAGLLNNEFEMYLQPQFDIQRNIISGFEALIRWQNPKYQGKSPQAFIEVAEQRGHMLDIGRFVITESFKLAKKLEPYGTHVSVNVSPIQLLQTGFVQQLIDEFNALELKEGSVAIEITETLLMGNFNLVNEKLKLLREKGFHIHLDDFCTGYSSMLYLKDLPVDTIKIDKEFTKYVETNKTSQVIIKALCDLANGLNLGTVCEGVETQEQADMVKKMGCRTIQGYLYGKAMPFDDAIKLIDKYNVKR